MACNDPRMVRVAALALAAVVVAPSLADSQTTPPMAGGYKDVIPIPVDDPTVKAIAGALFKPAGPGPFPAVVYMSGCAGLNHNPPELVLERIVIDHLLAKGVATLIVDPFTPRNEPEGVCALLNGREAFVKYATRGGNDAVAALKVVKAMPDIDAKRVFLQGYSFGAISSLMAVDPHTAATHDAQIAGLIAYYPYCWENVQPAAPTLVLIGEKDDWTPAALCEAAKDKAKFELAVFPDSYHAFVSPMGKPIDYLGHHIVYNEKAALDAQERADAFLDARLKAAPQ
jgi:dienelactone hydrolase